MGATSSSYLMAQGMGFVKEVNMGGPKGPIKCMKVGEVSFEPPNYSRV
jgi:hypothetical protein